MITQERIRDLFDYDSESGALMWRRTRRGCNRGGVAGSVTNRYRDIRIDGVRYGAHRLIWLLVHGYLPKMIDHVNGDGDDNRICNLRECKPHQNMQNMRRSKRNTSGVKGVNRCAFTGRWQVQIAAFGKRYFIGRFDGLAEAAAAREAAAEKLHGEFARHV